MAFATGGGSFYKKMTGGKTALVLAGKIRRFLEVEGRPMRACAIGKRILWLEGKCWLDVPGEYQLILVTLVNGLEWLPAPWRRVGRGVYVALEKEGGAA